MSNSDWIIDVVAGLLRDNSEGPEPAVFEPRAEKVLGEALEGVLETNDLVPVVQQLIALAYQLEIEEHCPSAAKLIASVVERATVTSSLRGAVLRKRQAKDDARIDSETLRGESTKNRFSAFTGRSPATKDALKPNRLPPKTF